MSKPIYEKDTKLGYKLEVERLKDIIKEAREYIEYNTYKANETEYMDLTGIKELLEILDKVGSDKE